MNEAEQYIYDNFRFQRFLSATELRNGLQRKSGECTWCGTAIKRGLKHCSDACRNEVYVRNGRSLRSQVHRRDVGVCAKCGIDMQAIQDRFLRLYTKSLGAYGVQRAYPHSFARLRKLGRRHNLMRENTPYDIDHIKPVVEGGGCCGLDNLQTLCIPCHRADTQRLAAKRAGRRDKRVPLK